MLIGDFVRRMRELRGLKRYELAALCHSDPSYLNRLERGGYKSITLDKARLIAKGLDIDPAVFFYIEDDDNDGLLWTSQGVPHIKRESRKPTVDGIRRWLHLAHQYLDDSLQAIESDIEGLRPPPEEITGFPGLEDRFPHA